jgi:serine/arginine repetitive matrix protein 1
MRKVELSVMRPWIARKVSELLGFEDDVVIEYVNGLLEDESNPVSGLTDYIICMCRRG